MEKWGTWPISWSLTLACCFLLRSIFFQLFLLWVHLCKVLGQVKALHLSNRQPPFVVLDYVSFSFFVHGTQRECSLCTKWRLLVKVMFYNSVTCFFLLLFFLLLTLLQVSPCLTPPWLPLRCFHYFLMCSLRGDLGKEKLLDFLF